MHTGVVNIQAYQGYPTYQQPAPAAAPAAAPAQETPDNEDPWAGYLDTLDLNTPTAPEPATNDFSAAAARLLQRQQDYLAAQQKAQEEAAAAAQNSQ